jgi:hypothetical protein
VSSGTITIGTSATLICDSTWNGGGVVVQNTGDVAVILGDADVAASGDTAGPSLAAGATLTIPRPGQLYGVVASGTGTVAFLTAN